MTALPHMMTEDDVRLALAEGDVEAHADLDVRTSLDAGGAPVIEHGERPPMSEFGAHLFETANAINRSLTEAMLAGNRAMPRIMLDSLTTLDSDAVAAIVDQIDEKPALFAIRYLTLESFVHQLHDRLGRAEATLNRLRANEVI